MICSMFDVSPKINSISITYLHYEIVSIKLINIFTVALEFLDGQSNVFVKLKCLRYNNKS